MRTQQNYEVGIYCRLSVDDGNNSESMSINNQRHMLTEHVSKQGWSIRNVYIEMITTRLIQFNYSLHTFGFGALSKINLHPNAPFRNM